MKSEQPSLRDRLVEKNRKSNAPESYFRKVIRHLLEGDFKKQTLRSGLRQLREQRLFSMNKNLICVKSYDNTDFDGIKGLRIRRYRIPTRRDRTQDSVAFVDFPVGSKLTFASLPAIDHEDVMQNHNKLFDLMSSATACFVGPTRYLTSKFYQIPNNGFYTSHSDVSYPFQDTNPPGLRRGAVAVSHNSVGKVMTDSEKWAAVNSGFVGYDVVAGTSFYFTDQDDANDPSLFSSKDTSEITYFVTYTNAEGNECMGHFTSYTFLTRQDVKNFLDTLSRTDGWKCYRAAELELVAGGCLIRPNAQMNSMGNKVLPGGFRMLVDRYDQYFITPPEIAVSNSNYPD